MSKVAFYITLVFISIVNIANGQTVVTDPKLDSINARLNHTFEDLSCNADIDSLQSRTGQNFTDLHWCIIAYSIPTIPDPNNNFKSTLLKRAKEITKRHFKELEPIFLSRKGGYGGGITEFKLVKYKNTYVRQITLPASCVDGQFGTLQDQLFGILNDYTKELIDTTK